MPPDHSFWMIPKDQRERYGYVECEVPNLLGVPIAVYVLREKMENYGNQAIRLMIQRESGFAPWQYDSGSVGNAIVARFDKKDFLV